MVKKIVTMIRRQHEDGIGERLFKGKAILIFGPRQAGKSTLVQNILAGKEYLYLNGDNADDRDLLTNTTATKLKLYIGQYKIIFINEAQRTPNIGITLKIITDQIKEVQVIATGSSAFDLSNQINEPLTGRKYEYMLYPLSFKEMVNHHGLLEEKRHLEHRLIYGYYPEIVSHIGKEEELLDLLASSYLYKDFHSFGEIKKPELLPKILKALALQVGNEIKYSEIAQIVNSDPKTVQKYIALFEKAYVLFQVPALSRNVRNEITKGKKIYFYDCGILNAVINNFRPISNRPDAGQLWENFVMAERRKLIHNEKRKVDQYFWRTTQRQEIDLIEEGQPNVFSAFEIKWNSKSKARMSSTFINNYPNSTFQIISPDTIENFLL